MEKEHIMISKRKEEILKNHLNVICDIFEESIPKNKPTTNVREIQQYQEIQRINSLLVSIKQCIYKFLEKEKINERPDSASLTISEKQKRIYRSIF